MIHRQELLISAPVTTGVESYCYSSVYRDACTYVVLSGRCRVCGD
jgi:hypothetical protein